MDVELCFGQRNAVAAHDFVFALWLDAGIRTTLVSPARYRQMDGRGLMYMASARGRCSRFCFTLQQAVGIRTMNVTPIVYLV